MARLGHISANALRQLLASAYNMAIPLIVVRFASKSIWGSLVPMLLFALLALQAINWGNKEFMLRKFSKAPNRIADAFTQNLATRFPLVVLASIVAVFWFGPPMGICLSAWIFGRFLFHSTEPLVLYEKEFNPATSIETASFIAFGIGLFSFGRSVDAWQLAVLYSAYQLAKGLGFGIFFRKFVAFGNIRPQWRYFIQAAPFFLLSILGFLASKIDVYLFTRYSAPATLADYQIINGLLVFVMTLSSFLYAPFTRNVYRGSDALIAKTRKLLLLFGVLIVPPALLVFHLILTYYLHLPMPPVFYFAAFAYVFPSFAYGIEVINLFRLHREKTVVSVLFAGALSNALLSGWLLHEGFGIVGALSGSAVAQLIALALFKSVRHEKK
jgi:hypothetical protein